MKNVPTRNCAQRARPDPPAVFAAAFSFLLAITASHAQPVAVTRIDPPHWWTGMQHHEIQLMVYGNNLGRISARSGSDALRVLRSIAVDNPSYAFVEIDIPPGTPPGTYPLVLANASDSIVINYPVVARKSPTNRFKGFTSADALYLITPDRFANGDTTNDVTPAMQEQTDRANPIGRHGGDIQGIIDHLDYLNDLGVTALWVNPLVENNTPRLSYHGYSATDHYTIDPRFGTNHLYQTLVNQAHRRGLKVIMDHVNNHISINHPWMKNLPTPDWLNGTVADHQISHHYNVQVNDIHADPTAKVNAEHAWFNDEMPDLNQRNPLVATYLIQNTLWWIESAGIDGIREDTYAYSNPEFLSDWAAAILREYPSFNIVGEVWISDPAFLAPFQHDSFFPKRRDSNLPAVTDFGLLEAFTQVFGGGASLQTLYNCLAKDFLYPHANNLMTFLDNHDTRRIMFLTDGDIKRTQLGLTILLTTRGIPQILYGTEIGMAGGKDHGDIRSDFPGGFPGDTVDAFAERGRTPAAREMFRHTRTLLRLRKEHPALTRGTLVHYPPVDEAYIYFRETEGDTILVVANNSKIARSVSLRSQRNKLPKGIDLHNLLTGAVLHSATAQEIDVPGSSALIFQLVPAP